MSKDGIYLDSIRVAAGPFEVGAAADGTILISTGTGKGQRIVGLTSEDCRLLHFALGEYLRMRSIEEDAPLRNEEERPS